MGFIFIRVAEQRPLQGHLPEPPYRWRCTRGCGRRLRVSVAETDYVVAPTEPLTVADPLGQLTRSCLHAKHCWPEPGQNPKNHSSAKRPSSYNRVPDPTTYSMSRLPEPVGKRHAGPPSYQGYPPDLPRDY